MSKASHKAGKHLAWQRGAFEPFPLRRHSDDGARTERRPLAAPLRQQTTKDGEHAR